MLMHLFQSWVYNFIKLVNGQCFSNQCGSYIDIQLPWLFLSQQLTGLDRNTGHTSYQLAWQAPNPFHRHWTGQERKPHLLRGVCQAQRPHLPFLRTDRHWSQTSFKELGMDRTRAFLLLWMTGTEAIPLSLSMTSTKTTPTETPTPSFFQDWQALRPHTPQAFWQFGDLSSQLSSHQNRSLTMKQLLVLVVRKASGYSWYRSHTSSIGTDMPRPCLLHWHTHKGYTFFI